MSANGEPPRPHASRGILELFDREPHDGYGAEDQPGSAAPPDGAQRGGDAQAAETAPLVGQVLSDEALAASQLQQKADDALAEREFLTPAARQELRQQVADFAEFAHRYRVPSFARKHAIGSADGSPADGITPVVVRAMAYVIRNETIPGLAIGQEELTDRLMNALVGPGTVSDASKMAPLAFAGTHGRMVLDVTMAADISAPLRTRIVRPGDHPELWEPPLELAPSAGQGADDRHADGTPDDAAAESGAGQPASTHADVDEAVDRDTQSALEDSCPAHIAAVISGPASAIAGDRPYLSLDALMSYAWNEVFGQNSEGQQPATAEEGVRAAQGLEIVVLLDPSMRGGSWFDVDPETGRPVAALAIDLRNLESDRVIAVRHLGAI